MAMFDDPKKELEQLQQQLLQEEEWFTRELDSAKRMLGDEPTPKAAPKKPRQEKAPAQDSAAGAPVRNYANGYGEDTAKKDKSPKKKKKKGIRGLVILAVLETLGIVGVVAYWMLFLLK